MAYGSVYVFNLYSAGITKFDLNDQDSAGQIPAPSHSSQPPYVPSQIVVGRTNLTVDQLNEPLFVVGRNRIHGNYGGQGFTCEIMIPLPPAVPLEADLYLYMAYQEAFLFSASNGQLLPCPESKTGSFAIKKA